jgi:predicted metalloendopeptidase
MTSATKKQKHKKGPLSTRKGNLLHLPKALPPFPQVPPIQVSKRPGYDFYEYVNSSWLRSVKTPPWRSAFGVSEELEEKIKKEFSSYLEPTSRNNKLIVQVEKVAQSALRPSLQKNNIKLLKQILQDVHCLRDTKDICTMLAQMTKYRITSLLAFYTYYEAGKKVYCRPALSIGQLGLPDTSYYFGAAPGKTKTLFAYGAMLDKIGALLELPTPLSPVVEIESYFAKEIVLTQTEDETYSKGSDLQTMFPGFAWAEFWATIGFESWESSQFRLNPAGWIQAIERAFTKLSMDEWKLLLTVHIILHALPMLPPPFDSIHFEFFEHKLRGQSKKLPQKELTIRLLQDWMPGIMSRLYLKEFVPSTLKSTVIEFTNLIRTAAVKRINEKGWFSPTTKKKAILKIQKMRTGVAYPNEFPPLPDIQLTSDNLLKNILLLGEDHTNKEVQTVNKVCAIENMWDDAIYAVNAYYYNDTNQMILPAGGLQWPFYHVKAPRGWNFGGLGAIVGHEMTHAFDSDGKEFDENGKKGNWWTHSDNREYNRRSKAIVALYNESKVLGHPVSGKLTLNENISDLGGLAIALDALLLELNQVKATPKERKEAYQHFFISYAVSWRIKEKPEKVLQGLFLDKHAPAPLRVNLVVSQFDEWYAAFDIQPGDELYIQPNHRIRIF